MAKEPSPPSDYFIDPPVLADRLHELLDRGPSGWSNSRPETTLTLYNDEWDVVVTALRSYELKKA